MESPNIFSKKAHKFPKVFQLNLDKMIYLFRKIEFEWVNLQGKRRTFYQKIAEKNL